MAPQAEEGPDDLTAARQAFDQGDLATCRALAEQSATAEAAALVALCWLDGGDYAAARERLSTARAEGLAGPDLEFARAELALREWRLDEARTIFTRLDAELPDPAISLRLALLADLAGDPDGADEWLRHTSAPLRLDPDAFRALVAEAAERLPAEFQAALEEVQVLIDAVPAVELVDASDLAETPPDILGLFVGASDLERSDADLGFELPPTIHLFQRNLERICHDRTELAEQIRITLWHELAHKLGFDEDGVDELGLA